MSLVWAGLESFSAKLEEKQHFWSRVTPLKGDFPIFFIDS